MGVKHRPLFIAGVLLVVVGLAATVAIYPPFALIIAGVVIAGLAIEVTS